VSGAAGAPFVRRRQVLGILSHGEVEARAFVMGVVTGEPAPEDAPESTGDAERLAASFRALALVLCAMLAHATLFALPGATISRTGRRKVAGPASRPAAPSAPDTS
jgi:hypothetical protein